MKDSIYYGNILGLLKTGKWSLSLAEAEAVVAISEETKRRLMPPKIEEKPEPIKQEKGIKRANK